MRQRFISGLLAILSIASLALLQLQHWTSAAAGSTGAKRLFDLHTVFADGAPGLWRDFVPGFLCLTLVVTALFSLLSFGSARRTDDAK